MIGAQRLPVHRRPQGLFPAAGHRASSTAACAPTRASRSRRCRASCASWSTSSGAIPAVDTVVGFTGGSRAGGGFLFIDLKPRASARRSRPGGDRAAAAAAGPVTGVSLFLNPVQDVRMGGRPATRTYQYTLKSDNVADLQRWAARLADAMKQQPALTDVDTDQQENGVETLSRRPRHRGAPGHQLARRRQRAVRRVRPAPGGDASTTS